MQVQDFDLIVLGGGPGGYVAAIRAAQLGMKTALVEREHLGGICLNWGCIPTKALLRSAEIYAYLLHAQAYGVKAEGVGVDLKAVVDRSRDVAAKLNAGVRHLLKKNKVTVIEGHGRLLGPGRIEVAGVQGNAGTKQLAAAHVIVATGARARRQAPIEPDGRLVWSYKEAMTPQQLPKTLVIVGSGAIGVEFASFYRTLGSEVTLVEMQERILPFEDAEVSAFAQRAFEKQGMRIVTSAQVTGLSKLADSVVATVTKDGSTMEFAGERLIAAVGIVGNVEDIGLESVRARVDRSHIVTDQWCRTDEPGVYAIGDVVGAPWLAHKASHEGVMCVEKIAGFGHPHPLDLTKIPGCTYCNPQVASVGYTEEAAKKAGYEVKVGRFPFIGNGKAIALGEPEGMVKTVFDAKTGEFLGAHLIGAEVTELIQGFVIARTMEATEEDLMASIFPHPTLSEMMHEATLAAYGRAIHF
jgi:dihydrolipoamide dehydrogenase